MTYKHDQLLKELGILPEENSFEICRQLKEKKNEKKALMTSRQSIEENKRLEEEIHAIHEAEVYFEKLAQEEKKEDKLDGFDYSSLQNKGRKNRRAKHTIPVKTDDAAEEELSFEERYDNIIGLMGTPDGFEDGLKQLEKLAEDGYVVAQRRAGEMYYNGEKSLEADWKKAAYWFEKAANQGDAESQNYMGLFYTNKNNYFPKDREQAVYWYKMAAEQNLPVACWNLSVCFDTIFEPRDEKEAFCWLKKAVELGYIAAFNAIGNDYRNGIGTDRNLEEAIKWYEKAAEYDYPEAYYNLASIYEYEEGKKDDNKRFYYYKKAAEAGNADAYNDLGICYRRGIGTEKNIEKAIEWYEKGAEQGDKCACCNLASIYEYEEGKKDDNKRFYYYKKAAEAGNADAYNDLGICYRRGIGTEKNIEKAIEWYEKGAEQGDKYACWNLASIYEYEEGKKDDNKRFYYYKKAAEAGNADAYNALGICYRRGIGTEKNIEKAIEWYEKGVEQGDKYACWNLASIYKYEEEKKDDNKRFYYYQKAAEAGNVQAYNELGICYQYGAGIGKNIEKAIEWYERAAESGSNAAYWNLGVANADLLEKPNYEEAIKWYKKSAETGYADAMYELGIIYEEKYQNSYEAAQWYLKAIQNGNQKAQAAFNRLSGR